MSAETDGSLTRFKRPLLYVMSALYVIAGVMHFVVPKTYASVVPPSLPRPLDLVYLSGIAEIALGVGLLFRRTRTLSAWGIVALLLAVFPANVYMATSDVVIGDFPERARGLARIGAWVRLPLQGVLLLWAWWYTRPMPGREE